MFKYHNITPLRPTTNYCKPLSNLRLEVFYVNMKQNKKVLHMLSFKDKCKMLGKIKIACNER